MQVWTVVLVLGLATTAFGHGRLWKPAGRATCWRVGFKDCAINYDDIQMNCGGYGRQWNDNDGKCGICGDPWDSDRPHEAGGKYARGVITGTYKSGGLIEVEFEMTTNHGGWHEFKLCKNDNFDKRVTHECLAKNVLSPADGGEKRWVIPKSEGTGRFKRTYKLPPGLTCTQCLLQWQYHSGNSWGCWDGECCMGCGPQEEFYGCADIEIK